MSDTLDKACVLTEFSRFSSSLKAEAHGVGLTLAVTCVRSLCTCGETPSLAGMVGPVGICELRGKGKLNGTLGLGSKESTVAVLSSVDWPGPG